MAPLPYEGTDGLNAVTQTNFISDTAYIDSDGNYTIKITYYKNCYHSITVRYSTNGEYIADKKQEKKRLEKERVILMKSNWITPTKKEQKTFKAKPKQSMFKNFAANSNRGN